VGEVGDAVAAVVRPVGEAAVFRGEDDARVRCGGNERDEAGGEEAMKASSVHGRGGYLVARSFR
jgi:hypothetical protein